MTETQQVVVLAGTLSTLAAGVIAFLLRERDWWRARAEKLEEEARKTAALQGQEAESWKKAYIEAMARLNVQEHRP